MLNKEFLTKKNKESFFEKGIYNKDEMTEEIVSSWKRSKDKNLNPNLSQVNLVKEANKYNFPTKDMAYVRDHVLDEIVMMLYKILDEKQAALFYAHDNGIVFSQRGNVEILQYLNSLNIGIGTCLREEYIGTTGLALINKPYQEKWVKGEEHYLNIFVPFVTYCFSSDDFYGRVYIFIILPKEKFTDIFRYYTRMFHEAMSAKIRSYRRELELNMKTEVYNHTSSIKNKAILYLDSFGKIVDANDVFYTWFNLKKKMIINQDCITLFPQLSKVLESLNTGKNIKNEKIMFHNSTHYNECLHMDTETVLKDDEITGIIITLSSNNCNLTKINKRENGKAHYTFDNILGNAYSLENVINTAKKVAWNDSTILITGESGTGKELFAQAIHNESKRNNGPFVAVNCSTFQKELIASELFGYADGAFTGAKKGGDIGKFECANKGTIFLDEIGELPMFAQTMLLRVLEEGQINKVGSPTSMPVDVRIISATNRDLKKMVKEGTFRLDLYFRINVVNLHLPALRERIVDIPLLVDYYIDYFNGILDKNVLNVSEEVLSKMVNYPWPGNLRELRNVVECSMNQVTGNTLEIEDLLISFEEDDIIENQIDFYNEERKKILCLLIEFNGNKSHVAEELGISRSTLYKKLKRYQLI